MQVYYLKFKQCKRDIRIVGALNKRIDSKRATQLTQIQKDSLPAN